MGGADGGAELTSWQPRQDRQEEAGVPVPFRAYHVLPPGSQQVKDRQEGAGVPVPFQGTPCLISFPVAEIADRPS